MNLTADSLTHTAHSLIAGAATALGFSALSPTSHTAMLTAALSMAALGVLCASLATRLTPPAQPVRLSPKTQVHHELH